jgi:hypothetical protein
MSDPIYSDEELAQQQQFQEDRLRALIELEAEDIKNWPIEVPRLTTNAYRIGLLTQIVKNIQRKRIERAAEDEISDDVVPEISVCPLASPQPTPLHHLGSNVITNSPPDILNAPPQPIPQHHCYNVITNSPSDIIAPPPLPPSPNISMRLPQPHLNPARYHHPPDIIAPPPLPPSPNISMRLSQPQLNPARYHHPPDILPPLPLPLKPNIDVRG